jgi:hypothetical protein
MRDPLGAKGALLGDFGVSLGCAMLGRARRARVDATALRQDFPRPGASLDVDFVRRLGYVNGGGLLAPAEAFAFSGGAGGSRVDERGYPVAASAPRFDHEFSTIQCRGVLPEEQRTNLVVQSYSPDVTHQLTVTGGAGTFVDGETVNATGGGTGTYRSDVSSATIFAISGTAGAGGWSGTLTGATSGATRTISASSFPWTHVAGGVASLPVVTPRYGTAPNGTQTAARVQLALNGGTTSTDQSTIGPQGFNTVAGSPTSGVCWIKSNTASNYNLRLDFNGSTADSGGTTSNITVTPTWQKFEVRVASALDTVRHLRLRLRGGLGTSDSADILVWHSQQENEAFCTSDIFTTTAQVTRTGDFGTVSSITSSTWFNPNEGTFLLDGSVVNSFSGAQRRLIEIGTGTERFVIGFPSSTVARFLVVSGGVSQAAVDVTVTSCDSINKLACSYGNGRVQMAANGSLSALTSAAAMPAWSASSVMRLGTDPGTAAAIANAPQRRVTYWPRALPGALLRELSI